MLVWISLFDLIKEFDMLTLIIFLVCVSIRPFFTLIVYFCELIEFLWLSWLVKALLKEIFGYICEGNSRKELTSQFSMMWGVPPTWSPHIHSYRPCLHWWIWPLQITGQNTPVLPKFGFGERLRQCDETLTTTGSFYNERRSLDDAF